MEANDNKLAVEFFEAEIVRNKRAARNHLIGGVVIVAILLVYFSLLMGMLNQITNPKELSEFVHNQAVRMLPTAKKELSASLKAAAPDVVRGLVNEVLKTFPEMREFAEKELKLISNEALDTAQAQLDEVYAEVLKSAKAKVIELDKAGESPNAQHFLDELKAEINTQITAKITASPEESVFLKLEKTHQELTRIQRKLARLAAAKDPTHMENLERQLLQSWILLMEDAVGDVDSADVGNIKTNIPKAGAPQAKKAAAPAPAKPAAPAPAKPAPAKPAAK
jgi:ribosomal protein S20